MAPKDEDRESGAESAKIRAPETYRLAGLGVTLTLDEGTFARLPDDAEPNGSDDAMASKR